jgi:uncharacterized protein with FMN-binding domain
MSTQHAPRPSNLRSGSALPPPPPPQAPAAIDPLLEQRLARLAARQQGAGTGPAATATRPAAAAPNRAKRRHAAKRSRAAALLMSIGTTAGLSAWFQHADAAALSSASASTSATSASTSASASATSASSASTGDATATPVAASDTTSGTTMADGTYVGETDTNKWGPVQVQITVSGGQITEVTALQTPDADGKSVQINNRAVPVLNSEVLTAQSADIDSVSGATYTSDSYQVSLQSAIDQAVAAGAAAAA